MSLTTRERTIRLRLKSDFEHYSRKCLKIRTKGGQVAPLDLNRAQRFIHGRLEEQLERSARVRALILKGRQQGCSTYVGGRFYHRTSHAKGVRTFILTHEDAATANLFEMANRFHENCPSLVRPSTGAANAKELHFDRLDSGYKVGTAGTKGVGRSSTIQLFHGSEVAFWPHAQTHASGVLQAVPNEDGTEIILESTANGMGNLFHQMWQDAERGIGDYVAIFVPWFWQEEYRKHVSPGFVLDAEEAEYAQAHGLDNEQMAWRRAKIIELKDPLLFKQEYPATAGEAFQTTGHDSFIKPAQILKARKTSVQGIGSLVIGVDPARFGDDRFSMAWRQGRCVSKIESRAKLDTVAGANWCRSVIDTDRPDRMFVDVGGIGAGVYDLLVDWGYADTVRAVNFGGEPFGDPQYDNKGNEIPGPRNRRAEMWMLSRDWLDEPGGVQIPDSDALQADACAPGYSYDSNQRLLLESKEKMRSRGVSSPDEWDAVALTFAEPVAPVTKIETPLRVGAVRANGWMGG